MWSPCTGTDDKQVKKGGRWQIVAMKRRCPGGVFGAYEKPAAH
jgi:hypothetical protein